SRPSTPAIIDVTNSRGWLVPARVAAAGALVLVATYYLLASIPFAYYHFLLLPPFWWLPLFIRVHPVVMLAAVAVVLAVRVDGALSSHASRRRRYAAIAAAATAACMTAGVWQPVLLSSELAAALCFVPFALLAFISVSDLLEAHRIYETCATHETHPTHRVIAAAATTGALCSATYFLNAAAKGSTRTLQPQELAAALVVSAGAHTVVFAVVGLVFGCIGTWAARARWPRGLELALIGGWSAFVLAVVLRRSVMSAILLSDLRATSIAVAAAIAVTTFGATLLLSRPAARAAAMSAVPARPDAGTLRPWRIGALALLAAVLVAVVPRLLLLDWGSTVQKLVVLAAWATGIAIVARLPARHSAALLIAAAVGTLVVAALPRLTAAGLPAARATRAARAIDVPLAVD